MLLVPICIAAYMSGVTMIWTTMFMLVPTAWYVMKAHRFWKKFDQQTARSLMFASFAYLPVVLLVILTGTMV
jgi:heme O synthase-like polyprenyltransferase